MSSLSLSELSTLNCSLPLLLSAAARSSDGVGGVEMLCLLSKSATLTDCLNGPTSVRCPPIRARSGAATSPTGDAAAGVLWSAGYTADGAVSLGPELVRWSVSRLSSLLRAFR